jgi:hypothetical protein
LDNPKQNRTARAAAFRPSNNKEPDDHCPHEDQALRRANIEEWRFRSVPNSKEFAMVLDPPVVDLNVPLP